MATGGQLRLLRSEKGPVRLVSFSPDGTRLLSVFDRADLVCVWNTETGEQALRFESRQEFTVAAFSPDGKRIACVGWGPLSVRDAETGQQLLSFIAHEKTQVIAFTPDGSRIVTAGEIRGITFWETGNWRHVRD